MDHRVSKDMISSGMTPSGEKTQADLGKTQYGSVPSPNRLMDAYHSMYQNQKEETLDEMKNIPKKLNPNTKGADLLKKRISGEMSADQVDKAILKSRTKEPSLPKFSKTDNPDFKKPQTKSMIDTVRDRRGRLEDKEGITARREKVQSIMSKYGESVDLLSAYQSIYADTFEEGKMPAGLQAYLDKKKGKKKDDDDNGDDKKEGKKKAKKDVKEGAGLYANIHAKRKRGGKMRKKGAKGAPSSQDFANAARTAKEELDLFDTVILEFVDQGYDEKEVIQAMSSLNEEQLQNLDEAIPAIAAALKPLAAIAKGSIGKTMTRAAIKMGGKSAGKIMKPIGKIVDNPMVQMQAMSSANQPKEKVSKTGVTSNQPTAVAASADLFDIVKGQLLDEGLSEEEIRDIMLELTPEEIMSEMAVNPKIAAMDAKNKADMIARAQANKVPDKIREASKRQMKAGTPREDPKNPYTTQDKKDIINYNKGK